MPPESAIAEVLTLHPEWAVSVRRVNCPQHGPGFTVLVGPETEAVLGFIALGGCEAEAAAKLDALVREVASEAQRRFGSPQATRPIPKPSQN